MKRFSISLATREMQIKNANGISLPLKMGSIKESDNKYWQGCKYWDPHILLEEMQNGMQPLWKTVLQSLKQLNIELSYNSASSFLGIYSREIKAYVYTDSHTQVFVASLFKRVKGRTNSNVHQWANKF